MAITYEPRIGLPQWGAGGDPFTRAQMDDAFAKLGNLAARGEQGPLNQLPAPAAPTLTTAAVGGTLAAGVKGYRITALSPAGGSFAAGETTPSAETTINVPAGTATNTVTVNWVAVPGATGYRIYGRTAGAELLLATVGAVVTWTDTGANPPAGALPAVNTTAGRPAPGIRNRTYWATDDRTGRYSYDDGAAWHDLGPSPVLGPQAGSTALIVGHASAATSDAVLIMRGKTGQTGDLLKAQDPTGATDWLRVTSAGELIAQGAGTASVFGARTTGDTTDRFAVRGDGQVQWADGAVAADLSAVRASAGRLNIAGTVQIQNADSGGAPLSFVTLALQAAVGQTGVLLVARDSGGFNVGTLDATGIFRLFPSGSGTKSIELQGSSGSIFASNASSYFGPFAMGGATTGTRLRTIAGSDVGLIAESDAATVDVGMLYRTKGAGMHKFQGPLAATTVQIDGVTGKIQALAADQYFGPGALGANDSRLRVSRLSASDVGLLAENPVTSSASLRLRPSGAAGVVSLQTNGGVDIAQTDTSTTTLRLIQNPGSDLTAHPSGVALSGRGLTVTADTATILGSPTAGVGVAINRAAPALSLSNPGGTILQGWGAAGAKKLDLAADGTLLVAGPGTTAAKIGPSAISGATGYVAFGSNGSGGWVTGAPGAGTYLSLVATQQPDGHVALCANGGTPVVDVSGLPGGLKLGFMGATPIAKPTVSGSKGANAALTSLMTALSTYGLVIDTTT